MDFRISRAARQHYGFDDSLFSTTGEVVLAAPAASRRFAMRMVLAGGSRPERPVHAGDIDAIALIHEVMHRAVAVSGRLRGDRFISDARDGLDQGLAHGSMGATLAAFENAYPSLPVYAGAPADIWLQQTTDGVPNSQIDLEEMLLLWITNQNPAFMVYGELYDDAALEETAYPRIVDLLRSHSATRAAGDPRGEDLVEKLLAPGR